MPDALAGLSTRIERISGIRATPAQLRSLLIIAHRRLGTSEPAALLARLDDPRQAARVSQWVLDEVTVNETFFFRHREELDIDWPRLLAGARRRGSQAIRVWSAGCATGEEAYTLAMLAAEAFAQVHPSVSVLGTDLSAAALAHAATATYGARSVGSVPGALVERYFERGEDGYVVRSPVRSAVRFERHNLAHDEPPVEQGAFDVVLCRNVLLYLAPAAADRALTTLRAALAPGGVLILGAADRLRLGRGAPRVARPSAAGPSDPRSARVRRPTTAPDVGTLAGALRAADAGRTDEALHEAERVLAAHPDDPVAGLVTGIARLADGRASSAADALRGALDADPGFALAAFQLGRALEALGDPSAAADAYERTLRLVERDDERIAMLVGMSSADVATAARARSTVLRRVVPARASGRGDGKPAS